MTEKIFNSGIASGNVVALAMTGEERHCESAVADAAVSSYMAYESNMFLRRRSETTKQSQIIVCDCHALPLKRYRSQ